MGLFMVRWGFKEEIAVKYARIALLALILLLAGLFLLNRYQVATFDKGLCKGLAGPNKTIIPKGSAIVNKVVVKPSRLPIKVTVTSGEVSVDRPLIQLCMLPTIGIETGRSLQPRLGVEFLRSERIEAGVSVGISPDTLDISVEKDMRTWFDSLQNTTIGIGVGLDKDGYSRILGHISLYI